MSFAALSAALAEWPGHRLFTAMAYRDGAGRRIWSSRPDIWPPGGEKPLPRDSELYRMLVEQGVPRLLDGADAIRAAFADHALILAAGCEAAVNLPVRRDGRTIGAINLLHRRGHYAQHDLPRLVILADAAAPLLLMET